MMKKISVLMGIYNCAPTLSEAIDSILAQTYSNWELILCDDGSTDNTYEVAENYRQRFPEKIILIQNRKNMGLNYTLNRCLSVASGEYIARMDGDDLCHVERFAREIQVLEENPDIALVSTSMTFFDADGTWGESHPKHLPEPIDFLHGTPFCHAPCMVRKTVMDEVNGYTDQPEYIRVEDFELWVRIYAAGYRGMNLDEVLYYIRDDQNAVSRRKFRYRINEARVTCKAVKVLQLPAWGYVCAIKPILVGLLPTAVYQRLHKMRRKIKES